MTKFTGKQLRAAIGFVGLSRDRLALEAGLNVRTLDRWCTIDDVIKGQTTKLSALVAALERHGCDVTEMGQPRSSLISVDLPPETLYRLPRKFGGVLSLVEIFGETRTHESVIQRIRNVTSRIASVSEIGGRIFFDYIEGDALVAGPGNRNRSVDEIDDREMGCIAAERNWKALLTGQPQLAFASRGNLQYLVLTVPTRPSGDRSPLATRTVTTSFRGNPLRV